MLCQPGTVFHTVHPGHCAPPARHPPIPCTPLLFCWKLGQIPLKEPMHVGLHLGKASRRDAAGAGAGLSPAWTAVPVPSMDSRPHPQGVGQVHGPFPPIVWWRAGCGFLLVTSLTLTLVSVPGLVPQSLLGMGTSRAGRVFCKPYLQNSLSCTASQSGQKHSGTRETKHGEICRLEYGRG